MEKKEVRLLLKSRRSELSADYLRSASEAISAKVMESCSGARCVMLYRALPGEVQLDALADELLDRGVTVVLPKVVGDRLEIRCYQGPDSLEKGAFNIMEPVGPIYEGPLDVVVVPGLGFDLQGHRIGFGKGFYDRFLPTHPESRKIGVCFSRMLLPSIPVDEYDVRMDIILTD